MKKRYLRLAALTAGVLLAAQTGLSAAALSTFDAAYYAAQYPDVAAVCGNDEGALLRHYLDHGIDEGRKPSADGIAGDDELSLTEAQFSSVWSPVALIVGFTFVIRDFVQREIGHWVLPAMLVGGVISWAMAGQDIAIASMAAFLAGETLDWAMYTFTGRPFSQRILLSSAVGTPIDSCVFMYLMGFFSLPSVLMMTASKMVGAVIVYYLTRRRELAAAQQA